MILGDVSTVTAALQSPVCKLVHSLWKHSQSIPTAIPNNIGSVTLVCKSPEHRHRPAEGVCTEQGPPTNNPAAKLPGDENRVMPPDTRDFSSSGSGLCNRSDFCSVAGA